jgi:hypothetical protein
MKGYFNIKQREPIWIALSTFYLDTELEDADFRDIAFRIVESPYSLEEVKSINKYEVFPILYTNLLSTAGVWLGFDGVLLVEKIISRLNNKTKLNDIGVEISYRLLKWMYKDYWEKLELSYQDIILNHA